MGYVGNGYGVSNAAVEYYREMIQNFSPREIGYMIELMKSKSLFSYRIKNYESCKKRFINALKMIDNESMSTTQLASYNKLLIALE